MQKFVEILPDKSALIERSHFLVLQKIQAAIATKDLCTIALAGGNTPKPLYEAIAKESLPWDKIHVFWGDERYVAPNDPNSNQKMARESWLNKVNISEKNIHPMPTNSENPEVDASKHEQELVEFFNLKTGEFPTFDVILLGMGDDGHTASLFPHTEALKINNHLVTVGNKNNEPRLTFTVPLINAADCVIFIVAGSDKQIALEKIFSPEGDDLSYPSRLIKPQGELWWLLDQSASEKIT
jgi:6-phosphogluconolactonase